jgi:hypothetical protein
MISAVASGVLGPAPGGVGGIRGPRFDAQHGESTDEVGHWSRFVRKCASSTAVVTSATANRVMSRTPGAASKEIAHIHVRVHRPRQQNLTSTVDYAFGATCVDALAQLCHLLAHDPQSGHGALPRTGVNDSGVLYQQIDLVAHSRFPCVWSSDGEEKNLNEMLTASELRCQHRTQVQLRVAGTRNSNLQGRLMSIRASTTPGRPADLRQPDAIVVSAALAGCTSGSIALRLDGAASHAERGQIRISQREGR